MGTAASSPGGNAHSELLDRAPGYDCTRLLDFLAAEPWRAGVAQTAIVRPAAPLEFDGRSISVPTGCEAMNLTNASGVRCPSGNQ